MCTCSTSVLIQEEFEAIESEFESFDEDPDNSTSDLNEPPEEIFEPLYPGAELSICGAYCAIMHFKSTCRIPFTTVACLLQLLQLICPAGNKLPKSVFMLKKFFEKFGSQKVRKQFCPTCHMELDGNKCSNVSCPTQEPDCLIHMDIIKQLKTILSRKLPHWDLRHVP